MYSACTRASVLRAEGVLTCWTSKLCHHIVNCAEVSSKWWVLVNYVFSEDIEHRTGADPGILKGGGGAEFSMEAEKDNFRAGDPQ